MGFNLGFKGLKTPGNYVEVRFSGEIFGHFSLISFPRYRRALMSLEVERLWGGRAELKGGAQRAC